MEKKNELVVFGKSFEGFEVEIIQEKDEVLFELYSTGMALGQVKESKGKLYARKDRIEQNISNAGISTVVRNGKQYLTEEALYDFMFEVKTDKCKLFRKWVTSEVLPELRKNGMYIMDNATEEQKLFNYKMINSTFQNCSIEKLNELYNQCADYYKTNKIRIPMKKNKNYRSDKKLSLTDTRLRIMRDIKNTIEKRVEHYEENKQFAFSSICDDVVKFIMEDISQLKQRISGGEKASKTKLINKLNPPFEDYMVINKHGMSNNYMTITKFDNRFGKEITVNTDTYKNWINTFPSYELIDKYDLDIDWDKPIIVFFKFDCIEDIDVQNLAKSAIDQIITRCYGEDDNIVRKVIVERNKVVDSYEDGKIYVCIQNI
jgi:prophage antirepressor-like protein